MFEVKIDNPFKRLGVASKKQIPFAQSVALNDLAFKTRTQINSELPKRFTIRSGKFLASSVRVERSSKKDLKAEVGVLQRAGFMRIQETGGQRKARKHRIAVPFAVRANAKQKITKAKRPRQLLQKPNVFVGKSRKGDVIYQRSKRGQLTALYGLEKRARYRPRWNFERTAGRMAKLHWERSFNKAFNRALTSIR